MDNLLKDIREFFGNPPTANQKAWGIINDFCHIMLTESSISNKELDITPDITVIELIKIADKYNIEIKLKR